MIDPKKELFKWGPIEGKILYIDAFMDQMVNFQNKFGKTWPDVINHIKDDKTLIIIDYKTLRKYGESLFMDYILNQNKCKKIFDHWLNVAKKITKWCYKHRDSDLTKLFDKQLARELNKFNVLYDEFWVYGFFPEIANWGGEKILMEYIEKNYPDNFNEIFEALTAPDELSFYQIEEKDLLSEEIEEHVRKYFWIENSYGGVKFITADIFKERLAELSAEKIKEIDGFLAKVKKRKIEVGKKFAIPKEVMKIASGLSFSIWWQDLRKKYIFMSLHVIYHLAKEIARRNKISNEDIEYYNPHELLRLAEQGTKVDLRERKIGYLSYYDEKTNSVSYAYGEKANRIIKKYVDIKVDKKVKEIKGLVTSKGKVTGKVRILSGSRHFDSMKEGEILVTSMTSPEFIVAMRKAAAIVTDEGGITCHAAIASRELGIPCVVATKIATRVLKNGDLVEVDADKGIVRKID